MRWLAIVMMLAFLGAVLWKIVSGGIGGARFVVKVTGPGPGGVDVRGQVPGQAIGDLQDFVASLELPSGAKFWGVPDRDRVQMRFVDVPEGAQQRIRNVLLSKFL